MSHNVCKDSVEEKGCGMADLDWELGANFKVMEAADETTECGICCYPRNALDRQNP